MEREDIVRCLVVAAGALQLRVDGLPVFGWHNKSAGSRVLDSDGNRRWLRVLAWPVSEKNESVWSGLKIAGQIHGVKKPSWLGEFEWDQNGLRCRADILELINDKPISQTPNLSSKIQLPDSWFQELRGSIESLHRTETNRVCVRQDLITRRLQERFGQAVDVNITEWETSHGDMHWANLTAPQCWLLDWEAWGVAPRGFDVALLYCFTLGQPQMANSIYEFFHDWLSTPSGEKAQMFSCAELMRMTELYSDHRELYPHLERLAEKFAVRNGLTVLKSKQRN